MLTAKTRRTYAAFRKAGYTAIESLRAARNIRKWDALESMGIVRLRDEHDPYFDPEDYDNPEDYEGMEAYGTIGEYRRDLHNVDPRMFGPAWLNGDPGPNGWQHADSVWGHTGYRDVLDPAENCYVLDIMAETIRQFRDAWKARVHSARCPT